ncbi:M48 family metalloprotease [Marinicella sp. W31]|uniref:M48 family metalloprotease n=1 Tax=Marinicella sp. W31 TaxID=3023713 RepID=UPI003756DFC5
MVWAKKDDPDPQKLILELADSVEKQLLNQYPLMHSVEFESLCFGLAAELKAAKLRTCRLIHAPFDNAYALANGNVYVTTSLLKKIRNLHQLGHILAHEWAHLELRHHLKLALKYQNPGVFFPKSKIKKMRKKHEREADTWANEKLHEKGYRIDQMIFVFARLQDANDGIFRAEHPGLNLPQYKKNRTEEIHPAILELIKTLPP